MSRMLYTNEMLNMKGNAAQQLRELPRMVDDEAMKTQHRDRLERECSRVRVLNVALTSENYGRPRSHIVSGRHC